MLVLLILIFISSILFHNYYWKRRKLPPGPPPLPILGNALDIILNEPGYKAYTKWHQQYGPVHTFWISETPIVAVTDYDLIMETFQKDGDAYAGRQHTPKLMELVLRGQHGVVFTEGDLWRDQRRFALHVFRNFGLGKNLMQERVLVEVTNLISNVQNDLKNGLKEHKIATHIDVAVGSIINNLLFGYRFDEDHLQEFYHLKRMVTDLVRDLGNPLFVMLEDRAEYAKYIPGLKDKYDRIVYGRDELFKFYENQISEHQKRVDHDSEPTDFVEAYLREAAKREEAGEEHGYSMPQLLNMCFDLWVAGQETTSNTLSWAINYLMLYPDVQARLQKELDQVIGSDRLITLDDRPSLPYTAATVNEIQRIANLVPMNVRHTTTRDVTINGYHIPKGTDILPQVSVVLYDEKVFPNHQKFDPIRFLDSKGQLKKVDELIPFSVGKRQCLGEGLARMELFLFTANIFNQFRISQVYDKPLADPNIRKIGGTVSPQPYVCHMEKRY